MTLQDKLNKIKENIDDYITDKQFISNLDTSYWVLDIEACAISENEMLTYSVALMSVDSDSDICYNYKTVKEALDYLIQLNSNNVIVYAHNLYYDFKPFLNEYIKNYNAYQNSEIIEEREIYNPIEKRKQKVNFLKTNKKEETKETNSYDISFKKGQLYQSTFYRENYTIKKGRNEIDKIKTLTFRDSYKIVPFSLKKIAKEFLDIEMSKQGLDYEKIRSLEDEFKLDEKFYIYEDVFVLKHLIKQLVVDGIEINGKHIQYKKLTSSSQSLSNYKLTLLEDFNNNENTFSDPFFKSRIEDILDKKGYFKLKDNQEVLKADLVFKAVYPPVNTFIDTYMRSSYYGGLSTVDFENVEKYSKYENKIGQVYDVNSLYPFILLNRKLPVGQPIYNNKPYKRMSNTYKENYDLYIQEITIYDMELKKGKMPWVQVKGQPDFNPRDVLTKNVNKYGKKKKIRLLLCNPLLDLLFECYDVKCYKLGSHVAFESRENLFKNYFEFWGEVKRTTKGVKRAISKNMQNALYGKFGSNPMSELLHVLCYDDKWEVEKIGVNYMSDSIYLPVATFCTSYAKQYLVQSINANRDRFMYCDTDSIHLFGTKEEVKNIFIHDKIYGGWKHEMEFYDFKYLGSKRYAEYGVETGKEEKGYNWNIKCCGLSNEIMSKIDDLSVFEICPHTEKELSKMKYYTKKDSIYYYYDKECTQKIKGLIKSKKSKIVKNGTMITETPYMITDNPFTY